MKKKTIKSFLSIFSATTINKILQFSSTLFIVRLITKEELGAFTYSQNILQIFLLLSALGLYKGALQFISESKEIDQQNAIYTWTLKKGIQINFLLSGAILLFSFTNDFAIQSSKGLLVFSSFLPIFIFILELQKVYFRGTLKNSNYIKITNFNSCLLLIGSVAGAYLYGPMGIIIGQYLAYIFSSLLAFFLNQKDIQLNFSKINNQKLSNNIKKPLIKYSIFSMVNDFSTQLMILLDVFLIGIILKSSILVADYKVASLIPLAISFIPMSLTIYLYPYFAKKRNDIKWLKSSVLKLCLVSLGINGSIGLILIMFSQYILELFFGSEYAHLTMIFNILILNFVIAAFLKIPIDNFLKTTRNLGVLLCINITMAILSVFLNIYLISSFSILGAAYSRIFITILSSSITLIFLFIFFYKKSEERESFK